jgi:aminoglycoside 3-N-acetyltransferase
MGEREAIDRVEQPVTVSSLVEDLRALGLTGGETVIVHSSMSALGWVNGGPQAVVEALRKAVTTSGTLVVPTFTGQYSDPADWENPPVPDSWIETIRETIPPFRPAVTPTRGMGAVPECFRNYPDVVRGGHPEYSFGAWGADARQTVRDHGFDYPLGEGSPLSRLYDSDGSVLLLGVGHENDTSLHLAEHRADIDHETVSNVAPVRENGERVTVEYDAIETSTDDFPDLGADFERQHEVAVGAVGAAAARLLDQRPLVDFAVEWFERER